MSDIQDLEALVAELEDITRGKHCPVCENSALSCTCDDNQCMKGHPYSQENHECPGFPGYCIDHCDDLHPHLVCMHGDHYNFRNPNLAAVAGGWQNHENLSDGICEEHEYCIEHCPGDECEHDDGWSYSDHDYDGGIVISATCDNCGKGANYNITYSTWQEIAAE